MNTDIDNYKIFLEVFKGYLDTALTANIWFYTLTGAVVSYYLSNRNEEKPRYYRRSRQKFVVLKSNQNEKKSHLKFSLFLPFALGIQIIVLSIIGVGQARFIELTLKAASNIQIEYIPAVEILVNFLKASIGLISLVCIGLILLFMFLEDFPGRERIMEKTKNKWRRGILIALVIVAYYILIYVWVLR